MDEIKKLLELCEKNNWIPAHDCEKNLTIISQTHSENLPTGQEVRFTILLLLKLSSAKFAVRSLRKNTRRVYDESLRK